MTDNKRSIRSRAWMFTINNYGADDRAAFRLLKKSTRPEVICGVYGKEVSKKGTPHMQCFLYFKNANSWYNKIKKEFPTAAKIQASKAPSDAFDYCLKGSQSKEEWKKLKTKGPNFGKDWAGYRWGSVPNEPGKRNDQAAIRRKVLDGTYRHIRDFILDDEATHNFQNHRYCSNLLCDFPDHRLIRELPEMPEVYWSFGLTGLGKTKDVRDHLRSVFGPRWQHDCFKKPKGKWWDNYYGQKYVHFEEFRGSGIDFDDMIQILDQWGFNGEVKGVRGGVEILADHFYFTTALDPIAVYKNYLEGDDNIRQLLRRIKEIRHYTDVGVFKVVTPDELLAKHNMDKENIF